MSETQTEPKKLEPKSEVQEVGPCKLRLHVEVAAEKVADRIDNKYRDLNNSIALPGFRKGHAPRPLMERKFGKGILEDLKSELMEASFEEVREEKKLDPLGEPEIHWENVVVEAGKAFAYDITIEVRPTFELKSYTGLKAVRPAVAVGEADIDHVLEEVRKSKAELVPVSDGAQEGDRITADVLFTCEGKEIQKSENASFALHEEIGFYGLPLKDFYKAFLGKKVGDRIEYDVDLPEKFQIAEAAGKKGRIEVALKGTKRIQLPEVNEDFLKSFDMDSLGEFREHLRKRIQREKEEQARQTVIQSLVDHLIEDHPFPLPEGLIQSGTEESLRRMKLQLAMSGVQEEEAETVAEKAKEESREEIIRNLRSHFLLDQIAQKERIFVTEDELEERIGRLASQNGRLPHEMRAYLEENGLMSQLRRQMREDRVGDFLLEKAVVEEQPLSARNA